jgi:ubiquinone/menaquinone biosynthesis C-methylase UbiE
MGIFKRRDQKSEPDAPGAALAARPTRKGGGAYDLIAEAFDRGDARNTFLVARDLVAALQIGPTERVLDVGTGTGVVPAAVREVQPEALVVGADASVGMLAVGVAQGRLDRAVGGVALDLPFRDQSFDVETANFVVSHFPRMDTALFDMRRVLRLGGRLGVTAWVPSSDEFERAWTEVAERYTGREILVNARGGVAPAEEKVGDPARLKDILWDAGFRKIHIEKRAYRFEWDRDEFLANRNEIRGARYMRNLLGDALWTRFQEDVAAVYRERFDERFGDSVEVLIAVAVRED